MKEYLFEGTIIRIGQNAQDNWKLLDSSQKDFLWLHLKSFPSGYVIICSPNPPKNVIRYAATLCKNYSKYRNLRKIKISQTSCANVMKGDKVGEAIFKSNRKVNDVLI